MMDPVIEGLEARIAELEGQMAESSRRKATRRRSIGRHLVPFLVALALPAVVLASDRFADVPTSSPYHADIGALAGAGITVGCGPTLYCPDTEVTREQMATFLHRGLGRIGWHAVGYGGGDFPTFQDNVGVRINAPARGWLLVFATAQWANPYAAGCPCKVQVRIRHAVYGVHELRSGILGNATVDLQLGAEAELELTSVGVLAADKGYNYLYAQVRRTSGTAALNVTPSIVAMWIPFGADGGARP
jgi:hypothetical protein